MVVGEGGREEDLVWEGHSSVQKLVQRRVFLASMLTSFLAALRVLPLRLAHMPLLPLCYRHEQCTDVTVFNDFHAPPVEFFCPKIRCEK